MNALQRFFGRLGRRYWVLRADRALARAWAEGLIDSWLLHALDHHIKYAADPGSPYGRRPKPQSVSGDPRAK